MKFTEAWGEVLKQNNVLKTTIIFLALSLFSVGIVALKLSTKEPFVVERGCLTKEIQSGPAKFTPNEVSVFVKEALASRFNSQGNNIPEYLAESEQSKRLQEQKEFSLKNISQTIVVREIKVTPEKVMVEADRLLAVGNVRSALPFNLQVQVSSLERTATNPYGLRIDGIQEVKNPQGVVQ